MAFPPFQGKEFPVEVAESILGSHNPGDRNGLDAPVDGFTGSNNLLPWG